MEQEGLIIDHVIDFYKNLCKATPNVENELIEKVIPCLVTEGQNKELCSIPTEDEIKLVVFSTSFASSIGSDGFGAVFINLPRILSREILLPRSSIFLFMGRCSTTSIPFMFVLFLRRKIQIKLKCIGL